MCLSKHRLDPIEVPEATGTGWKVFILRDSNGTYSPTFTGTAHMCFSPNIWLTAVTQPSPYPFYMLGFHIFTHRRDAEWWLRLHITCRPELQFVLKRVRWNHKLASGIQELYQGGDTKERPVVVAKYMLIEEDTELIEEDTERS